MPDMPKFDVALSYASEQRDIVQDVKEILESRGLKVFWDQERSDELKNNYLTKELYRIYGIESRYVAAFISPEYLAKQYTRNELDAAKWHSDEVGYNCVIPIFLKKADFPATKGYRHFDADGKTPVWIAQQIYEIVHPSAKARPATNSSSSTDDSPVPSVSAKKGRSCFIGYDDEDLDEAKKIVDTLETLGYTTYAYYKDFDPDIEQNMYQWVFRALFDSETYHIIDPKDHQAYGRWIIEHEYAHHLEKRKEIKNINKVIKELINMLLANQRRDVSTRSTKSAPDISWTPSDLRLEDRIDDHIKEPLHYSAILSSNKDDIQNITLPDRYAEDRESYERASRLSPEKWPRGEGHGRHHRH